MKNCIHARLSSQARETLEQLKAATGATESALVRQGLELVAERYRARPSALDLAGDSVGKVHGAPRDLSSGARHLEAFGE